MPGIEAIGSAVIRENLTPWRVFDVGPSPRLWTPLLYANAARSVAYEAQERLIAANLWNRVKIRFTNYNEMCAVEIILKR